MSRSVWTETATATAALATATRAAESGKTHYVVAVAGSFSAAQIAAMTLKSGTTAEANFYVHNQHSLTFSRPIRLNAGEAAVLELGAGGAGVVGAVTLVGFTE